MERTAGRMGHVRPSRVPLIASSVLAGTLLAISAGSVAALVAVRASQDDVRETTSLAIAYREVQNSAAMLALAEISLRREDSLRNRALVVHHSRALAEASADLQAEHGTQDPERVRQLARDLDTYEGLAPPPFGPRGDIDQAGADRVLGEILQTAGDGALQARQQNAVRAGQQERLLTRLTWLVPAGAVTAVAALSLSWRAMLRRHGELVHLAENNDDRANHDPLTGLANRGPLQAALADACAGDRPFAVLVLDLDRFKEVNDTRGHAAGDALLRDVADALRASVRTGDVLSRIGGDEFIVLLREPEAALQVAERLRTGVAKVADAHGCGVTLSVGICRHPAGEQSTPEELLARADAALYRAKRAGRDAVAVAP